MYNSDIDNRLTYKATATGPLWSSPPTNDWRYIVDGLSVTMCQALYGNDRNEIIINLDGDRTFNTIDIHWGAVFAQKFRVFSGYLDEEGYHWFEEERFRTTEDLTNQTVSYVIPKTVTTQYVKIETDECNRTDYGLAIWEVKLELKSYLEPNPSENEKSETPSDDNLTNTQVDIYSKCIGLLYKISSLCGLRLNHDFLFLDKHGHHYEANEPEIIRLINEVEALEQYPEIQTPHFVQKNEQKKYYNVHVPVVKKMGNLPFFGIKCIELNEENPCGENHFGLFVTDVEGHSAAELSGVEIGDIIIYIERTKANRTHEIRDIEDLRNVVYDLYQNEPIKIGVRRLNRYIELPTKMVYDRRTYTQAERVRLTRFELPKLLIEFPNLVMTYRTQSGEMRTYYMKVNVERDEQNRFRLVMNLPESMKNVRFEIDNKGNLIAIYE